MEGTRREHGAATIEPEYQDWAETTAPQKEMVRRILADGGTLPESQDPGCRFPSFSLAAIATRFSRRLWQMLNGELQHS